MTARTLTLTYTLTHTYTPTAYTYRISKCTTADTLRSQPHNRLCHAYGIPIHIVDKLWKISSASLHTRTLPVLVYARVFARVCIAIPFPIFLPRARRLFKYRRGHADVCTYNQFMDTFWHYQSIKMHPSHQKMNDIDAMAMTKWYKSTWKIRQIKKSMMVFMSIIN